MEDHGKDELVPHSSSYFGQKEELEWQSKQLGGMDEQAEKQWDEVDEWVENSIPEEPIPSQLGPGYWNSDL